MFGAARNISAWTVFLAGLSIVYLLAEILFNISLLEVAGNVASAPSRIDSLQQTGRLVSGFGCSLLVLGFFAQGKFQLKGFKSKVGLTLLAGLCLLPMAYGVMAGRDVLFGAVWALVAPLVGVLLILQTRGRYPWLVAAAVVMIVWPAAFYGQKMLIDETLVRRTTAAERLDARYALMLRAGFENCTITLDDLQFCAPTDARGMMQSARIIFGALWMLSPQMIRHDLVQERERIITAIAARGLWFSPKAAYAAYVSGVHGAQGSFAGEWREKFYTPYKKASDAYIAAFDPAIADKAADEVEARTDAGWREYNAAVVEYRRALEAGRPGALHSLSPLARKYHAWCRDHDCSVHPGKSLTDMKAGAAQRFQRETGYPPDIADKKAFIEDPLTQRKIRDAVMQKTGIMLTEDWRYDRAAFKEEIMKETRHAAQEKWQATFGGKMPPGLSAAEFARYLGLPDSAALPKIMDETTFFRQVILPRTREMARKMLDNIDAEGLLYAEGQPLAENGRNYVRAAYIPALSLVISLSVVTLTLIRGALFLVGVAAGRFKLDSLRTLALKVAAVVILLAAPFAFTNPYAAGAAYHRYLAAAQIDHPAITPVLDWAMHAQPVMYWVGQLLRF